MARWPDNFRANLIGIALIFVLFPLLCWATWVWLSP
jgi:predicted Na+-dependent transporter